MKQILAKALDLWTITLLGQVYEVYSVKCLGTLPHDLTMPFIQKGHQAPCRFR